MASISIRTPALIGATALAMLSIGVLVGWPQDAGAAHLAATPVMTLPPGPTTSVPLPDGTLPPGPTYHETITIYQMEHGQARPVTHPVLGSRVRFRFCFTQNLSKPRMTLVLYHGQDVPGAPVLYRHTMLRQSASGSHYCFATTFRIGKKRAVGRDTASFTIWSGTKPIIVWNRMFTVREGTGKG
jgi:hypothetical protein